MPKKTMDKENLAKQYVQIATVVSLYWVVSISTVFINKTLLSSLDLDAPLFITWFQCLTTVVICYSMKILSQYFPNTVRFPESDPFNSETVKNVIPLSILFTMMISANNLCLKYVSVAFYYISRSLTTIFNVLFTYAILGESTSRNCLGFCALIILGFFMGVDQESLAGSLSLQGTIFGILGSLSLSLYSIYTKRVLPSVNNEVLLLSYYNNIYSLVIFIPLMFMNGEFPAIYKYPNIFDADFLSIMLVGGICGFSIGFVTTLQIKVTSPLTHNVSGTAKACAQTILATYWYQETKSLLWWFSNGVILFGSAGYARIKQLEMEKKHNSQLLSEKC